MATIAEDIDRAVPAYEEGDGKSWWAVLADGTRRGVNTQVYTTPDDDGDRGR
jgi:hypothetical protein